MDNKDRKYPEGHFVGMWMSICIAIFSGFGIPLSIVSENYGFIGIGPAIGVAVGSVIGQSIENKYRQEGRIRALSQLEAKRKNNAFITGIIMLTLGIAAFIILFFL